MASKTSPWVFRLLTGPHPYVRAGSKGIWATPTLPALTGQESFLILGSTRAQRVYQAPLALQNGCSTWALPPPHAGRPPGPERGPRLHPGRGFNQEAGPQVSASAGRLEGADNPRRGRGRVPAAPPVRPDRRARTPVRDGPGWRARHKVCCRPLRSRTAKRAPCSDPLPRPLA
ncbi:hypothetical protein NDU88_010004 [Pleurodeles waltl]|uniref:Uncharacterized protein n=1 Tax=Pleurodeles waltl TaxID=8319 RepID=A0AAV7RWW2_PLEWA|nr:hypothetical protein NDU88_010004 [Pleurodeles waltl]